MACTLRVLPGVVLHGTLLLGMGPAAASGMDSNTHGALWPGG